MGEARKVLQFLIIVMKSRQIIISLPGDLSHMPLGPWRYSWAPITLGQTLGRLVGGSG